MRRATTPPFPSLLSDIVKLPKWDVDRILEGPPDSIQSRSGRIVQTIQLKELIFNHRDKLMEEAEKIRDEGGQRALKLKDLVSKHVVNMHVETQSLIKHENTSDEDQALELQKLISQYIVNLHDQTQKILGNRFVENEDQENDNKFQDITKTPLDSLLLICVMKQIKERDTLLGLFMAAEVALQLFTDSFVENSAMKDMVTPLTDYNGNNMLHLAAMRTRKKNLEDVPGAALQMQRELLWFKEVERMIPPSFRERKNNDGFTPRELFTMEHQDLIE
ncbi:hypothetical protein Tco_0352249 [Tanacetum coccineum]